MGGEMLLGATFSFGFIMAYGATQVAGRLLDVQMGFGVASVLSPTTQAPSPVVGSMFGMAFVAVFLALDGHHVLLQALSVSVRTIAPGQVVESIAWSGLLEHSSIVFVFGLALAAPVMFALLLADLALAVFARSMPQLNVFILSFALKIVLGLCGLALSIRVAERVLASLTGSVFGFWGRLANG